MKHTLRSFGAVRDGIQRMVYRIIDVPVRMLLRMGVTPNMITTAGLLGNVAAAGLLVWAGMCRHDEMLWPGVAAAVLLAASLMDMVDGYMARTGGLESRFGAFYDSVLDRYCELVTLGGIALYLMQAGQTMGAVVTFASLVGSVMVSYTRARAEGLGIDCKVGLMQRPERVVVTVAGLALAPCFGYGAIIVSQLVVAVLANATAWVRIMHCRYTLSQMNKKMKHNVFMWICLLSMLCGNVSAQKEIYIPKELRGNNFECDSSRLSYKRMAQTDNFVMFWERGFGHDLSCPPKLEGHEMKVDLARLMAKVERFYRFYADTLGFLLPDSKAERYRMMAILNYSLEGTAYGGDYDGQIGALWIAPNRLQDEKLNCIAHELGHSFQSQIACDGTGKAWGGGGIFEMASQWMLWQVNPEWVYDEAYHWEAWQELTHKPFLAMENIYHSPYVLEWWSVKRGLRVIADLFRAGKKGEDPVMTYKRMFGLSQQEFCTEMLDGYSQLLTYDWDRVREVCRPIAGRWKTKVTGREVDELHPLPAGSYTIDPEYAPGDYGFNAIAIVPPTLGETVTVCVEAQHRLVGVRPDGKPVYFEGDTAEGPLAKLFLVVMGAPEKHKKGNQKTYPYSFTVTSGGKTPTALLSPDGKTHVSIFSADTLMLAVSRGGVPLLAPSPIYIKMSDGKSIGLKEKSTPTFVPKDGAKEHIIAPFYRQAEFDTEYNELTIKTANGGVTLRAYNEGVAYRFFTNTKQEYTVLDEGADFRLMGDPETWLSYTTNKDKPMAMAFQNTYTTKALSQQDRTLPAFLPATVGRDLRMTILESDLEAYPGMWLQPTGTSLRARFAPYPKATAYYPWRRQQYVTDCENFIAKGEGPRTFPWRIMAITEDDRQMPVSNLVYALASENRIGDTSWIKPGKSAWEWWNDWALEGVGFKAGINTETYKHYIDFAARRRLEYMVLDEGWYTPSSGDMLTVVPEIDLKELIEYGKEKGVGIILWTVFNVLDDQLEEACKHYSEMGVKGFKVDFLDRDDQTALEMIYRIADFCARYKLMLDYHGIFKPTGLARTYPNVVNYEACFGMEETKWNPVEKDMPKYDVTMPFIRGMAGPVDFTPGAMRNASKSDWKPIYSHPMSQGTRCHQAAMYVCYDSPLTMLADSPSTYDKDEHFTSFIASIPTVFAETHILSGRLGEYIVVARKDKEGNIYVARMNNWDRPRVLSYNVEGLFDADANYTETAIIDGPNAEKSASDYQILTTIPDKYATASGGGFVHIYRKRQ